MLLVLYFRGFDSYLHIVVSMKIMNKTMNFLTSWVYWLQQPVQLWLVRKMLEVMNRDLWQRLLASSYRNINLVVDPFLTCNGLPVTCIKYEVISPNLMSGTLT